MNRLAAYPLLFQPGARWKYGYSTDVLGRVVEVAAGQDIEEAMADRVFGPLGMDDTGYFIPGSKAGRFAGVTRTDESGALVSAEDVAPKSGGYTEQAAMKSPGGGLSSTARDYMAFALMLLNGGELNGERVLSTATVEYLRQAHVPPPETPFFDGAPQWAGYGFGLGFGVLVDPIAQRQPTYAGEYRWGGLAETWFWIDPEAEIAVVGMSQHVPGDDGIGRKMRQAVYQAISD